MTFLHFLNFNPKSKKYNKHPISLIDSNMSITKYYQKKCIINYIITYINYHLTL